MQTFDQALLGHYQAGRVSMDDALRVASSPNDFKLLVSAHGRTSTSMDDLNGKRGPSSAGPVTLRHCGAGASQCTSADVLSTPAKRASLSRQPASVPEALR